jgi:hypothetical protein
VGRCVALRRAARLLLAVAGLACGGDEPRTRTFRDVGEFCVNSDDAGRVTFSVVVTQPCLSGCEGSATACSATLTETHIELRSVLELRELPEVMECPAGCFGSMATCELENLPPDDYQLRFASRVDAARLPFEGSIPLFGDHDCDAMPLLLPNPYPAAPGPMEAVPEFEGGQSIVTSARSTSEVGGARQSSGRTETSARLKRTRSPGATSPRTDGGSER